MGPILHYARLRLTSSLACVDPIEQLARSFASLAGFEEDTVGGIALAAREAAVNAVVHGNRSLPEKLVSVEVDLTAAAFVFRITDEGKGFEPENVPDPLLQENLLRSSGRGIFLMRTIMDDVHFSKQSTGSTITLVKHRT